MFIDWVCLLYWYLAVFPCVRVCCVCFTFNYFGLVFVVSVLCYVVGFNFVCFVSGLILIV